MKCLFHLFLRLVLVVGIFSSSILFGQDQIHQAEIQNWILGLNSLDYADRDNATTSLRRAGKVSLPFLWQAVESNEPEVRTRAQQIYVEQLNHAERLKELETVESIDLAVMELPDGNLRDLLNLKKFNLIRSQVSNSEIKHLAGLEKLESLSLHRSTVNDPIGIGANCFIPRRISLARPSPYHCNQGSQRITRNSIHAN